MTEEKQVSHDGSTFKRKLPLPSKISDEKLYNYIKKIEVDGLPRVRAYAEAIDKHIYDLQPQQISKKLDYLKANAPNYDNVKEMVLAEQQEWAMRRSSLIQDKAMNLLNNLLDKANEIATDPKADAKDIAQAVATLKAIMPAYQAVGAKKEDTGPQVDKKKRAAGFIN